MLGNLVGSIKKLGKTQSAPPDAELKKVEQTVQTLQSQINRLRNTIYKWNEYSVLASELALLAARDMITSDIETEHGALLNSFRSAQQVLTSKYLKAYKSEVASEDGTVACLERWSDEAHAILEELSEVRSVRNSAFDQKMKLEQARNPGRGSLLGLGGGQPDDVQRAEQKYRSLVHAFRTKKNMLMDTARAFHNERSGQLTKAFFKFTENQHDLFRDSAHTMAQFREPVTSYRRANPLTEENLELKEHDVIEVQIVAGPQKGRWVPARVVTPPNGNGDVVISLLDKSLLPSVQGPVQIPQVFVRKNGVKGCDPPLPSVGVSLPEAIGDVKTYENILAKGTELQKPSPPRKAAPTSKSTARNSPVNPRTGADRAYEPQPVVLHPPTSPEPEAVESTQSPEPVPAPPKKPEPQAAPAQVDLLGFGDLMASPPANTSPNDQNAAPTPAAFENAAPTPAPKRDTSSDDQFMAFFDAPVAAPAEPAKPFPGLETPTSTRRPTGASMVRMPEARAVPQEQQTQEDGQMNAFDPFSISFDPSAKPKPKPDLSKSDSTFQREMNASLRANSKLSAKEQAEIAIKVEAKVKAFNEARQAEKDVEAERLAVMDRLDPVLRIWEYQDDHTRRNIRNLLSTLDNVLWANSTWKSPSLGDLLTAKNVKKYYRKAIFVIHPDKHQKASLETQVIAERCFEAINEQWNAFDKGNS